MSSRNSPQEEFNVYSSIVWIQTRFNTWFPRSPDPEIKRLLEKVYKYLSSELNDTFYLLAHCKEGINDDFNEF